MKRPAYGCTLAAALSAAALSAALLSAAAFAQSPAALPPPASPHEAPPWTGHSTSAHPELWLYLHEQQRYDDARLAVRRNAELRSAQRRSRIEARKWAGHDPARPTVPIMPYLESHNPTFPVAPYWTPYYYLMDRFPTTAAPAMHR